MQSRAGSTDTPQMTLVAIAIKSWSRVLDTNGNVRDTRRLHSITLSSLFCRSKYNYGKVYSWSFSQLQQRKVHNKTQTTTLSKHCYCVMLDKNQDLSFVHANISIFQSNFGWLPKHYYIGFWIKQSAFKSYMASRSYKESLSHYCRSNGYWQIYL